MIQRIAELKDKQVVCVEDGTILGFVGDIELDTENGKLSAIIKVLVFLAETMTLLYHGKIFL